MSAQSRLILKSNQNKFAKQEPQNSVLAIKMKNEKY